MSVEDRQTGGRSLGGRRSSRDLGWVTSPERVVRSMAFGNLRNPKGWVSNPFGANRSKGSDKLRTRIKEPLSCMTLWTVGVQGG